MGAPARQSKQLASPAQHHMKAPGMEKHRATRPLRSWHGGDKSRRHQKRSCVGQAPSTGPRRVPLAWCWLAAARHPLATHSPCAELPRGVRDRGSGMGAETWCSWQEYLVSSIQIGAML